MWIGDQFGKDKAEQLSLLDLVQIFSPTPETSNLERATNHIILGAKGSGKSTLLRALTLAVWQKRLSAIPVQFIGVHIPIRYEDASYFLTSYEELQNSTLFEHFFVVSVLYQATTQLNDADINRDSLVKLFSEYLKPQELTGKDSLTDLALKFLKEREACILAANRNPNSISGKIPLLANESFAISKIQYLAGQFATIMKKENQEGLCRFGIFIDAIDYYGNLMSVLAPLFESDSSHPLVVKASARSLDVSELALRSKSRNLEIGRDFDILSLDREPDNEEHLKLLKDAVCRRAKHKAPPEISGLNDENILSLLFSGSTSNPDDLASFNSFCRLSSGNILQVILLLDEASTIYKNKVNRFPGILTPIPRDVRLQAVEQESRKFWDLELGVRLPQRKLEATIYCESLVEIGKEETNGEELLAPSFHFNSIPDEDQSLVASLLSTRVLVAHDSVVHQTLQAGFPYNGKVTLELNRLMLPAVGIRPLKGRNIVVDTKEFHKKFNKSLMETKPHLSPKSTHSKRDLFLPDFTIFISLPFDKTKKCRTTILRKAINKLYEDITGKVGREGLSYIDIHYIPHVGAFRFEIPKYINEATYFVADVSEMGISPKQTGGVFYEIGLAIGLKKPLALFYNCKDTSYGIPPFKSSFIPPLLTGQTIITVNKGTSNFFQEFKPIHENLIAHSGYLEYPLGISKTTAETVPEPFAYLSFQPRNNLAFEWCKGNIKNLFPELNIIKARNWDADDAPTFYHIINKAAFCIIDCTQSVNNNCIELGACSALEWRKVLEAFDSDIEKRVNPVSMFPGKRLAWTDLGENDTRQLNELLIHFARTTNLGLVRT